MNNHITSAAQSQQQKPSSCHVDDQLAENIPQELRDIPRWVAWRWEWRPKADKWTKPPIDPSTGRATDATNPLAWMTFELAQALARDSGDGIGLTLGDGSEGLVGIDLDECIDDRGVIADWAAAIIVKFASYTERTPSGSGLRIWIHGQKPGDKCRKGSIEIYSRDRYFTITGRVIDGSPLAIATRQPALDDLYRELWPSRPLPGGNGALPTVEDSDDALIEVGRKICKNFSALFDRGEDVHGNESSSDMALLNHLAFLTGKDAGRMERIFGASPRGQREKWTERPDYRQRSIQEAIEKTANVYDPRWRAKPGAMGGKTDNRTESAPRIDITKPDAIHRTELGNARRLAKLFGKDIRYWPQRGEWLIWKSTHWQLDEIGEIRARMRGVIREILREASEAPETQVTALACWALESEKKRVFEASISLAQTEPGIAVLNKHLDSDPYLLNTPSGTIDLKTGKLRAHRKEDLITQIAACSVDMEADCPLWKKVILEIMEDDQSMVDYLQRALGYSLTGNTGEHAFFICHGSGRNGKNTILDTVRRILGAYTWLIDPKDLMAGRQEHPTAIAQLVGRRYVVTSEVEDGDRLAEGLVKRMTGDDELNARFMRQNNFTFPILFKVWMLTNPKPEIRGMDEAIWSRIRMIPFNRYFKPEERIKNLGNTLVESEGPAILGWLVKGCLEWQRIGLAEPKKVLDATMGYRTGQDVMEAFLSECCNRWQGDHPLATTAREKTRDLYDCYANWCKTSGEKKVLTFRSFGLALTDKNHPAKDSNSVSWRYGIKLKLTQESTRHPGSDDE